MNDQTSRISLQYLASRFVRVCMKSAIISFVLIASNTAMMSAQAADIPGFDNRISIAAREQPIGDFFAELFGRLGLPVNVDSSIIGTVNGDFRGSARDIYRDVEKAFQLVMYYDRSTVFIYSSNQMSRKIIPMSEQVGKKVLYNAKKMRIGDAMNKVEWSDMGLVVSGTERYRRQIESYTQAIRKRTSSSPQTVAPHEVIKVFKLKYAWADDTTIISGGQELLVRGVASLLRSVVESGMVAVEPSAAAGRTSLPRTEQGLRGKGLQAVGREPSPATIRQGLASQTASVNALAQNKHPSSTLSNTRIVADPLNNAIIIRDRADRMQNYQELISTLDIEPQMVEIEATIIDMDTDRLRTLGIDWRYQSDGTNVLFGSAAATGNLLNTNPEAITDGLNGFTQNVLNNKSKFLSHIRALETQGAARIVSKPHVMTLANVEALLDTTSTFFVRVAGKEEVDLFNVSVGTTMRVTPHVFNHGDRAQIKLKIDIIDGNQSQQTVDDIPVIDESTINTQAIINAGQSLLIGGLVREFKTTGVSKIPLLGDIPGLGALFRSNRNSSSRMERMFLITPRLNNQASVGKRYSVPILAGSQEQILETSPARLEPALAGLAARDEAYPIKQALPSGQANVDLSIKNQAYRSTARNPQSNAPEPQNHAPTIRDRLSTQQSDPIVDTLPVGTVKTVTPAPQHVASTVVERGESEWQAVRAITPPPRKSETVANARKPVSRAVVSQAVVPKSSNASDEWIALPNNRLNNQVAKPIRAVRTQSTASDGWTEILK